MLWGPNISGQQVAFRWRASLPPIWIPEQGHLFSQSHLPISLGSFPGAAGKGTRGRVWPYTGSLAFSGQNALFLWLCVFRAGSELPPGTVCYAWAHREESKRSAGARLTPCHQLCLVPPLWSCASSESLGAAKSEKQ